MFFVLLLMLLTQSRLLWVGGGYLNTHVWKRGPVVLWRGFTDFCSEVKYIWSRRLGLSIRRKASLAALLFFRLGGKKTLEARDLLPALT